jgi:hypothetical protein
MKRPHTLEIECKQCKTNFIVNWNKRNQLCCSISCSLKLRGGWNNHNTVNWSEVNKEAYRTGHNYVAGGTTKWYQYKDIKVQGTFELRTCKILDRCKELQLIANWEYTTDRIEYVGVDDTTHNYLLDFKVLNNDGSWYYIEVKGRKVKNDELKWNAVNQIARLEVWTLSTILTKEKEYGL